MRILCWNEIHDAMHFMISGEMLFEVRGFYSHKCGRMYVCGSVEVCIRHHWHYTISVVLGWHGKAFSCWYFK